MDKKNNQNDNPNKKKNIKSAIILLVVCLGITALFTSVMSRYKNGSQKKISYSKFLTMLDKGEIKKVQVADRKIYIEPKTQQNPLMKTTYYTVSMNDALLVNRLKEAEDNNKISSYEQFFILRLLLVFQRVHLQKNQHQTFVNLRFSLRFQYILLEFQALPELRWQYHPWLFRQAL